MTKINEAISKLEEYDDHYVKYSDKLSTACRQLAFAEGAVFWVFKEASSLSFWIAIGFLMLVLYFSADVLQYYFGMRDYEKLAQETRVKIGEKKYKEINKGDANKRLEGCLKWKLIFIAIASMLLIFVFVRIFLNICSI